jgi:hypothetical protein
VEVRAMLETHSIRRNGPYVHVALPDVLSPDWHSLRRQLDEEIEDGMERAFIEVPAGWLPPDDEAALKAVEGELEDLGVEVVEERRHLFAEVFLG